MRKKTISKLKKEADKVFSDFIRDRDSWECCTCGNKCPDNTDWRMRKMWHAGHYIARDCLALRYDEKNVNCQCYGCNVAKKGNYPVYALKMMRLHGDNILYDLDEVLRDSKANIKKYSTDFYENIINKYK